MNAEQKPKKPKKVSILQFSWPNEFLKSRPACLLQVHCCRVLLHPAGPFFAPGVNLLARCTRGRQ